MKNNFLIVFSILVSIALTGTHTVGGDGSNYYKVYKIDSVNNYYFIYAKRRDTLYKIVSRKEVVPNCTGIKLNQEYSFILSSLWTKPIVVGNVDVSPSTTPNVTCISLDGVTKVCLERDSINDIFVAKNLRGLCIVNDNLHDGKR
ncbi:hypothetical protein ACI6Q2_22445 [Chitinophagaceae bacterium LWZ2-11]